MVGITPVWDYKFGCVWSTIPTGKIHAHSFVLRPELRIQYTCTYIKNSEHHQFWIRCTYLVFLLQEMILQQIRMPIREDVLGQQFWLSYEYIYVKKSPGIRTWPFFTFPNFVERSMLRLHLSKLWVVPLALQNNRALFGEEKRVKGAEKRGGRGLASEGGEKEKRRVKTGHEMYLFPRAWYVISTYTNGAVQIQVGLGLAENPLQTGLGQLCHSWE